MLPTNIKQEKTMKIKASEYIAQTKNTIIRINVPLFNDEKLDINITNCEDDGYEIMNIDPEELKELSDVFLELYKLFKK